MKLKSRKRNQTVEPFVPPSPKVAAQIDKLGERYDYLKRTLAESNQAKEELSEYIRKLGENHGQTIGTMRLVQGNAYEIGVQLANGQASVDWVAFTKTYPHLAKRLSSVQIDEEKVAAALADGTLSAELVKKFTHYGSPQKRVVVRKRKTTLEEGE